MLIYFAGPDVFRPDFREWRNYVLALCDNHNWTALIPGDGDQAEPASIFESNMQDLNAADVVIVNLNPFRGCEPDSGAVFEAAYGLARGKLVIGYLERPETPVSRVRRLAGPVTEHLDGWRYRDGDGWGVEDTELSCNLMLAYGFEMVVGGVANALARLAEKVELIDYRKIK